MILGVGIDLCPIARMEDFCRRWGERGEAKLFTAEERRYCRGKGLPGQHFAARFAAKEAALKALGVPEGLSWHELEIVSDRGPRLVLSGVAARAAAARGVVRAHVTLTHVETMAAAVVVLEGA